MSVMRSTWSPSRKEKGIGEPGGFTAMLKKELIVSPSRLQPFAESYESTLMKAGFTGREITPRLVSFGHQLG